MQESKLFQSLNTLDVYELNRFHKFLLSPYFNVSKTMLQIFESLDLALRDPDIQAPEKESIWNKIFDSKKFDDRRFRKYSSDLLKLFEQFLAQESFQSNPIHQAKYLLDSVANRKIDKLYNSSVKTADRLSSTQIERPASYYFYQYEFERSKYDITDYEINRSQISNIESIVENLDRFYLAEKLRYYCTVLSRQNIRSHEYNILFMNEIMQHVDENDYSDVPPIKMYNQILKMNLDVDDRKHFDKLKKLIQLDISRFPEQEAKEIVDSALNYAIKNLNKGKPEFLRESFDLYQEALANDLLYVNNELSPWAYKNIVTIGLRLKEFNWVEKFINDYQAKINSNYRENALSFNMAQLFFYQKEYRKVIEHLQLVEYDDMTYNLNSKTFLMGSYYELDEYEALHSLLDSFRIYLKRNKDLTAGRKSLYSNMIKIVKKLAKLQPSEKIKIEKLKKEMEAMKAIASKNWILEKLAELEG